MDIGEKRNISHDLSRFTKSLEYNNSKINLLGSAGLKSQQNHSDYDLFCNIEQKDFNQVLDILSKTKEDDNMFLIEIKFENSKRKVKCRDMSEFTQKKSLFEKMKITMIKLDFVAYISYKLVELSIIYSLKKDTIDVEKKLKEDSNLYKKEGDYYKALKREFSMLNMSRSNNDRLILLSKIFNSHFGGLYVIYSNLNAIKLMKDNYDDVRSKKIIKLNLIQLGIKEDKIDVVCRELKKLFNDEAKKYLE
jgi:hypothetical protein